MLPTSNQLHAKRNGRTNPTLEELSEYLQKKCSKNYNATT
jgi:hypothetical protein